MVTTQYSDRRNLRFSKNKTLLNTFFRQEYDRSDVYPEVIDYIPRVSMFSKVTVEQLDRLPRMPVYPDLGELRRLPFFSHCAVQERVLSKCSSNLVFILAFSTEKEKFWFLLGPFPLKYFCTEPGNTIGKLQVVTVALKCISFLLQNEDNLN